MNSFEQKAAIKIIKAAINKYKDPILDFIKKKKADVVLKENETEVCLLVQEQQGQIIASAPVFDNTDRITRYVPLSEKADAISLLDLIQDLIKK